MRFDVALVLPGGGEDVFHDAVGAGEGGIDIAVAFFDQPITLDVRVRDRRPQARCVVVVRCIRVEDRRVGVEGTDRILACGTELMWNRAQSIPGSETSAA